MDANNRTKNEKSDTSQLKLEFKVKYPAWCEIFIIRGGIKTLYPHAELNPIAIKNISKISIILIKFITSIHS
jgi:hypothetical protein